VQFSPSTYLNSPVFNKQGDSVKKFQSNKSGSKQSSMSKV
jgi:hypothetical protein